jgi:hypothetical protein
LDLIDSLQPTKVIPGHIERGWALDAKADMDHNRKYLGLLKEKVFQAKQQPPLVELRETFEAAFPEADANRDFFLGHLSNQFGKGGQIWEENKHQNVGTRTEATLQGYQIDRVLSKAASVLQYAAVAAKK